MAYHMWNIYRQNPEKNKAQHIHSHRMKAVEYMNKEIVWQPNVINIRQLCKRNDDGDDVDDDDDDRIEHISYTYDKCYRPKQRIEKSNMLTEELTFRSRSHTQKKDTNNQPAPANWMFMRSFTAFRAKLMCVRELVSLFSVHSTLKFAVSKLVFRDQASHEMLSACICVSELFSYCKFGMWFDKSLFIYYIRTHTTTPLDFLFFGAAFCWLCGTTNNCISFAWLWFSHYERNNRHFVWNHKTSLRLNTRMPFEIMFIFICLPTIFGTKNFHGMKKILISLSCSRHFAKVF